MRDQSQSKPKVKLSDLGFGLLFLDSGSFDLLPTGPKRLAGAGRANPGAGAGAA